MKRLWQCVCVWSSLLLAVPAAAFPVTLTLVPSSAVLSAGQTLSVDIVVAGLTELDGDFEQEVALESFDLDLAFDSSRLQFTALTFGGSLGDPEDSFETYVTGPGSDPNADSVVALGVFSLLSEAALLGLQNAPFLLATVEFEAQGPPGSALLELIDLSGSSLGGFVGSPLGDELTAPAPLFVTLVPEPGMGVLLLAGCAVLGRRARAARA